jgi:hypothetical protein
VALDMEVEVYERLSAFVSRNWCKEKVDALMVKLMERRNEGGSSRARALVVRAQPTCFGSHLEVT